MPQRSTVVLAALLAVGATACSPTAAKRYDPFRVPRERFYGSLKVVALAPVRAPSDLENADEVKARFTATIEARLREAGLRVIPPSEVGPMLEAATAAQGGLFDPVTGKMDEAKAKAAKATALSQLREKLGADALLRTDLRVVSAPLDHDVARWDGVTDQASTGFWKTFLAGSHSGRIPALSFVAWLSGVDGSDLYANAGGLRVLVKVNARGEQVRIPHAELFADEIRNANAVAIALGPLLGIAPATSP